MKSVKKWTEHWNAKNEIENPIVINGYCIEGRPISEQTYYAAVVDPVIAMLDLKQKQRVLDIGCGTGLFLHQIEKYVHQTDGTDISSTLISRYTGKAQLHVCPAHKLPFHETVFDRILMFSVAIYFPDFDYFQQVVKKTLSLLRPDGLFLIGDLLIGSKPKSSQYFWLDRERLLEFLDQLDLAYHLMAQNKLKRSINRRWDILIRND